LLAREERAQGGVYFERGAAHRSSAPESAIMGAFPRFIFA